MAGVILPYHMQSIERYIVSLNGAPRELTLKERQLLDVYVGAMVDDIIAAWPVDTGNSRDQWAFVVSGRSDDVGFTIENLVDYTEYVHAVGDPTPLADSVVPDIIDKWLDRLMPVLRDQIAATQREIAANQKQGGRGLLDVLQRPTPSPLLARLVGGLRG